jgi:hypothetical protein
MTQHYDQNYRPLVPPAERAFLPAGEHETAQETVWFNPTDKDAILDLYIGVTPCRSMRAKQQFRAMHPLQKKEFRTGFRRYIIRAGERRSIHSDFDQAIQQTHCMESECTSRPMYCRDATHHKMVTGGLGPQLVNEAVQFRPIVHPSLIEAAALEKAAEERAKEFLRQKEVAEASMAVAHAEAEKARALRDSARAAEEKATAQAAAPQPATTPAHAGKKDK